MNNSLPPHDTESEAGLLGCLLLAARDTTAELIATYRHAAGFFYDDRHQELFSIIIELADTGKPVDAVTVLERIRRRGLSDQIADAYVTSLPDYAPTTANWSYHAERLQKLYVSRSMLRAGCTITEAAAEAADGDTDAALDRAEAAVMAIRLDSQSTDDVGIRSLVVAANAQLETAWKSKGALQGLATGFYDLDKKLRGLKPGQLVIVAARPGWGKTSLAMNMAERVAVDDGVPVGVFSLEMTKEELVFRMLCSRARVPSGRAVEGELDATDLPKWTMASVAISRAPLTICDDGGLTIGQLRARARRMVQRHGVKLLIVDYLQLMTSKRRENRNVEVGEISNGLKALAKELRLPVIALSQLNREIDKDTKRKPRLSDLRDSGSVEQDADIVLFIHPEEGHDDSEVVPVNLIVAKHRNGPVGPVKLVFRKPITRFEGAAKDL